MVSVYSIVPVMVWNHWRIVLYVFREKRRTLIMDKLKILKTLNREAFIQEEALRIDEEAEFSICHGVLRTIQILNEYDLMKMADILQATIHFAPR